MENKTLNRQQMQTILDNAPQGVDKKALIDKFVSNGYTVEGVNDQKPTEKSLSERAIRGLGDIAQKRIGNVADEVASIPNRISTMPSVGDVATEKLLGLNPIKREMLRLTGQAAGAINDMTGGVIGEGIKSLNDATGKAAQTKLTELLQSPIGQEGIALAQKGMDYYNLWKKSNPESAKDLEAVVNITALAPQGKVGEFVNNVLGTGAKKVANEATQVATSVIKNSPSLIKTTNKAIQNIGKTPKTLEKAVGEIAQGTTEAINPVKTALSVVDTSKVNTYSDLLGQINKTIPDLVTKVDNELLKDSTKYSLSDLAVKKSTKAGTDVVSDYVTKGLNELKDYYTSIGDDVAKADIEDLITRANTEGLTRKEVNDIARLHGKELSAYNANGQLSSGLTKQAAENTRKGLKEVARQGLGGKEAKMLDEQLSALYDTSTLIEKNVERVNRLQQLIQERGLLEKAGNIVTKYADMLTGGTIRGLVGGMLPRGAGYKVMNALDLEEELRNNLDIVEKALKSKTDKELLNNINQLKSSKVDSVRSNSSLNKNTTTTTNKITNNTAMNSGIPQTPNKASGKLGGFAQLLKETPDGKLKGKMVPEDADAVVDFAEVVNGESIVPDKTYLAMRKEIKKIAKQYNISGKTDRELVDNLTKKIYRDYHKFPGFSELGLLPKLAIGTAGGVGAVKLMSTQDK